MPVQINEIIIRANIVEKPVKQKVTNPDATNDKNKDDIIKECTEIILNILKAKVER